MDAVSVSRKDCVSAATRTRTSPQFCHQTAPNASMATNNQTQARLPDLDGVESSNHRSWERAAGESDYRRPPGGRNRVNSRVLGRYTQVLSPDSLNEDESNFAGTSFLRFMEVKRCGMGSGVSLLIPLRELFRGSRLKGGSASQQFIDAWLPAHNVVGPGWVAVRDCRGLEYQMVPSGHRVLVHREWACATRAMPKSDNLTTGPVGQEQVAWFDVPMHDGRPIRARKGGRWRVARSLGDHPPRITGCGWSSSHLVRLLPSTNPY